ncbi:MAG: hypothetical protein FWH57_02365 [Oscillospiraceae bacterium]|nr:hypothetical protein [Oscillospiraceae bacterium]
MLEIDFRKAYLQAAGMAQCAEGIVEQKKKLEGIIDGVRGAWQGETASAYIKKLEALGEKLEEEAKKIREDAAAFRAKIDYIKRAEEAAQSAIGNIFH